MLNPSQMPSFSVQSWDDKMKDSPVSRTYIPIICLPNLDGTCKGKETGCRMYHSNQTWFWQYRKNDKWINLPLKQVKEIDKAFCDVSADIVELSPIPKKPGSTFGNGSCKVCFSTMTMRNAGGSISYDIRRLSTVSSAKSDTKRATTFEWFFEHRKVEAERKLIDDRETEVILELNDDREAEQELIDRKAEAERKLIDDKEEEADWEMIYDKEAEAERELIDDREAEAEQELIDDREAQVEWELIDDYKRIESHFLSFPTSTITVSHKGSKCKVYLSKMAGKNIGTGEEMRVRRRPKMEVEDESNSSLINSPLSRVNVPIICPLFLNEMCKGKESGCRMYHTDQSWVWQLKIDSTKSKFPLSIAKGIEQAYGDVSVDVMELPPMPKKLWGTLGKGSCKLCFSSMTIMNSNESVTYDVYRLSTPSSIKSNSKSATTFQWFLCRQEAGGEWELIDGHKHIELQFVSSPLASITFSHKGSCFQMSFSKMVGKNLGTGECVCVRRRPKMEAKVERKGKVGSQCLSQSDDGLMLEREVIDAIPPAVPSLPQFWERSEDKDEVMLVPLDPQSKEALQVKRRVLFTIGKVRDVKIVRVQNPRMFYALNNKITELKRMNKETWIHRLFHCPQPDQVETICRDNFSPKLQMTNINQNCGKGTYFFMSAALAGRFCPDDTRGGRVLMLADVFIGDVTKGNSSLTGPPKKPAKGVVFSPCVEDLMKGKKGVKTVKTMDNNDIASNEVTESECDAPLILKVAKNKCGHCPNSGEVYDTVVEDTNLPEIFVKYNKRDYCPRYIITYS